MQSTSLAAAPRPRAASAPSSPSSTAAPAPGTWTATTATSSCYLAPTSSTGGASASNGGCWQRVYAASQVADPHRAQDRQHPQRTCRTDAVHTSGERTLETGRPHAYRNRPRRRHGHHHGDHGRAQKASPPAATASKQWEGAGQHHGGPDAGEAYLLHAGRAAAVTQRGPAQAGQGAQRAQQVVQPGTGTEVAEVADPFAALAVAEAGRQRGAEQGRRGQIDPPGGARPVRTCYRRAGHHANLRLRGVRWALRVAARRPVVERAVRRCAARAAAAPAAVTPSDVSR